MYADGLVCLRPLPEEVYGTEAAVDIRLRQLLDGSVLSESETAGITANELQKVRARFGDLSPCIIVPICTTAIA